MAAYVPLQTPLTSNDAGKELALAKQELEKFSKAKDEINVELQQKLIALTEKRNKCFKDGVSAEGDKDKDKVRFYIRKMARLEQGMNEICKRKMCYNAEREIVEQSSDGYRKKRLKKVTLKIGLQLQEAFDYREEVYDKYPQHVGIMEEVLQVAVQLNEMTLPSYMYNNEFDIASKHMENVISKVVRTRNNWGRK